MSKGERTNRELNPLIFSNEQLQREIQLVRATLRAMNRLNQGSVAAWRRLEILHNAWELRQCLNSQKDIALMSQEEIKKEINTLGASIRGIEIDPINDARAKRLRILQSELSDRRFNEFKQN